MILFHIRILFKDFLGYQRDKKEKEKKKKHNKQPSILHANHHSASSYSRRQGV